MKNTILIITAPCWNCDKEMRIALMADENGNLDGGPDTFSERAKEEAQKHGVHLKMVSSKTAGETYLANVCDECDAFVGQWFYFAHYYTPALYGAFMYTVIEIDESVD